MAETQKYSLVEELIKADDKYMNSNSLFGMTVLTFPKYINSMRATMFTSHLKQFLNLKKPDFPFVFTNAENLVGSNNNSYKEAKHDYKVFRKVVKFEDIVEKPNIYQLFVYDKKNDRYEVITRKCCEDLTENFGFDYDNTVIDSLEEGDKIKKGTVLYKSSSYDDDMNYGYGKNITVMYTLDPWTAEDAAVCSESLAKEMTSIETEVIRIGMNDNDFLLNLYGDKDHYKALPDIGESCSGIMVALRRQFNNQLLYDFKESSLREIHEGDVKYYVSNDNQILDYTIYSNNEERKDNVFNEQINRYLDSQNKYYKEILETCEEIMESGSDYSGDIDYMYKRAKEMLDTKKRWKEGDNAFSNVVIDVTVRKENPLGKGQKVTG